ncbi:MAG TPA: hypothetical protein VKR27_03600, partial [Acidimicrobiales bacterium]|nr:hypothetical protein [Acidimicrobiales bacterium]
LERAIRVQSIASNLGEFTPIPDSQIEDIRLAKYQESFLDEYWSAWNRCPTRQTTVLETSIE